MTPLETAEVTAVTQVLWLPGIFPSTNRLLDMQRSSGHFAGVAAMTRGQRGGRPRQSYSAEVRRIRDIANIMARAKRLRPVAGRARLFFWLLGADRFDPSAWYLSAKAVEDGLCDAGVIPSDRFNVWSTGGRCVRGQVAALAVLKEHGQVWKLRQEPVGLLVKLEEVAHAAD